MQDNINLELLLRDMYEAMSAMSLVLDKEHEALARQDVEQLQQAAVSKEDLSEQIQQLELRRHALLQGHDLDNSLASMRQLIQQSSQFDENALYKIWNMVAELVQECSDKNKLNGIIIESSRRQTNAALSVLQGYQGEDTQLYDAEGATVQAKRNSTIARA